MIKKVQLIEYCSNCGRPAEEFKPQGLIFTGQNVSRELPIKCLCGAGYVWRPLTGRVLTKSGCSLPKRETQAEVKSRVAEALRNIKRQVL